MELWTALLIGLAGSLHCIGMCGPIAVALPGSNGGMFKQVSGRALYNLGRVLTYSLLGLICGFVGKTILMAGYQRWVSIGLGVLILLAVFLPTKYAARLFGGGWHASVMMRLKGLWQKLLKRSSLGSLFVIGILNGFLPCGLVYVALAGSITTGSPVGGAAYMAMFGLGTFPVMFAMAMAGNLIGAKLRRYFNRIIPVMGVVLAVLFILRGMSLGIPFISPKLGQSMHGEATMECCHPKEPPAETAP